MTQTPAPADLYNHALADAYDALKMAADYEIWADLLEGVLQEQGCTGRRFLDVGCGTGTSSLAMQRRGFEVTACDISEEMLEIARGKDRAGNVRFLQADMRALPDSLAGFHLIHWLDDVANHLLGPADLGAAVRSSAGALVPGGVLVFDVNPLATFTAHYSLRRRSVVERDDTVIISTGLTARPSADSPAEARLTAFRHQGDGLWTRRSATVLEHHFEDRTVRNAIADAGLDLVGSYGFGDMTAPGKLVRPADEQRHPKIVYVARRPVSADRAGH
ncbi:class I SAM-dependent methyltransferase [Streptomyces sporangiiformans]|uniref:Class I SAM-dependent methyltransferase n=1 Tax=Streptomyces sporangiiformans TaxID=2315329 RepID=A0A505DQP0_9ACTN|nr:class I SAM-dependent methyltransferase [Streptomyces sporangiiformans]TPQ23473.1 class I SAM-dependent methyltransferase [Streptomyces sporangiiformans]